MPGPIFCISAGGKKAALSPRLGVDDSEQAVPLAQNQRKDPAAVVQESVIGRALVAQADPFGILATNPGNEKLAKLIADLRAKPLSDIGDFTAIAVITDQNGEIVNLERLLIALGQKQYPLVLADLTGAYLTGAYLRKANLTEANLTGADLRKANLTEANLTGADLRKANLTEADLTSAYLRKANLTEADLRKANLTGADLRKANLTEANLTGAFALVDTVRLTGKELKQHLINNGALNVESAIFS